MTRAILMGFLAATLALSACGRRESGAEHRAVAATTPAAAHVEPHAESDLHVGPDTRRDLRITTAVVARASGVERMLEVPGEILADEDACADIGSPVHGRVTRVLARAGQQVSAGEALVEIRSPEIGRARAEHASAVARRTLARQSATRVTALVAERIAPARERQEAEAALAAAEADVEAAATMLRAVGVDPASAAPGDAGALLLRTPIAGVVLDREATIGQSVDPARTLFRVADLSRVWLVAQVFERDAGRIRVGSTVRAAIPATPEATRTGRVTWTGKRVSPDSRTLPIRIDLPNADGALKPGMTATAFVPLANTSGLALTVPVGALQRLTDSWVAFLPRGDDQWHFEVRTVGRGRDLGEVVEILSGLAEGERVVVDGAFVLKAEADKARGGARAAHTH